MGEHKFFICKHCGNLIGMIHNSGVPIFCCGEPMAQLVPGSVDASQEKHVPVAKVEGNVVEVKVGAVAHPMTQEHHIPWIYLETEKGGQRRSIKSGEAPEAVFALEGDKPVAVYAYCNLHGLWKAEI